MIIHSKVKDYRVEMVKDIWSGNPEFSGMSKINRPFFFIDGNLFKFYGPQLKELVGSHFVLKIDADERNKEYIKLGDYYRALIEAGFTRNDSLVTLGGGIVQDISGFIASTLYRGINWIFVPTTLLAQSDSCIGSKTSLNYKSYKNLVGSFFPPNRIFLCPSFTQTLRQEDYMSGLGEVVKLHLLGGEQTVRQLIVCLPTLNMRKDDKALLTAIQKSLEVKISYMKDDEFDNGKRNMLNFGHCFGHAIESTSSFAIPHGQAVVIGMMFANIVAKNRRLMGAVLFEQLHQQMLKPTLTFYPGKCSLDTDAIFAAMQMDKKRTGAGLALIMLVDGYKTMKIDDLAYDELATANRELQQILGVA